MAKTDQSNRRSERVTRLSRRRSLTLALVGLFVASAVVSGALELSLRLLEYGDPEQRDDPFFGFRGTPSAFVQRKGPDGESHYVPRPAISDLHQDQEFAAQKPNGVFRIFVFGGSTVNGSFFGLENSFPIQLERLLVSLYPQESIEVINWGVSGYGSTRVAVLVEEGVRYSPDLVVVYTGQNEFRDALFHAREIRRSDFTADMMSWFLSCRLGYLVHQGISGMGGALFGDRITSYGAGRTTAVLSQPFSEDTFRSYPYFRVPDIENPAGDPKAAVTRPALMQRVRNAGRRLFRTHRLTTSEAYDNFGKSIRRIIEATREHDVELLFLAKARNPKEVSALRTYVVPASLVPADNVQAWQTEYQRGINAMQAEEYRAASEAFLRVQSLYGEDYAGQDSLLHLYLGEAYERAGFPDEAVAQYSYRLGKNHHELNRILAAVAGEHGVPVIDVAERLAARARSGVVGYHNYFVDAVHLTPDANHVVALSIANYVRTRELVPGSDAGPYMEPQMPGVGEDRVSASIFAGLAWAEFNQGNAELALEYGQQAVARNPDLTTAHLLLGYAYTSLDDLDMARRQWNILDELWRSDSAR